MAIVTTLFFISHSTVVLPTQIHDTIFDTIHHCVTEINHTIGLCVKAANKEHKL